MEFKVDSFILYLATERGLSTAYQLSVRQTLDKLLEWVATNGHREWRDLGTDELSAFLGDLRKTKLDASSLRIAVVHLKIFFRFLQKRHGIEIDPAEPLLSPKTSAKLPETLNQQTVENLLGSIDSEKKLGKRDLALLELFYASGLRLSEFAEPGWSILIKKTTSSASPARATKPGSFRSEGGPQGPRQLPHRGEVKSGHEEYILSHFSFGTWWAPLTRPRSSNREGPCPASRN